LVLFGVLLLQSASAQRAQLEGRVRQVLDALANDLDREFDRDLTILHTLATSRALESKQRLACKDARIWCSSMPMAGNW
jgi:hypothetical protein